MSVSLPENQNRDLASTDRTLPTDCAEPDCRSRRGLQLVLAADPVPTARMLCRTHRKAFWRVSS